MLDGISAVAFDIDGTLYSSPQFYVRIIPYFLKNFAFYLKYNKVRKILHHTAPLPDFYEYQARLFSELTGLSVPESKKKIQEIVYDGLIPYFKKIKTFKYVEESFKKIKEAGYNSVDEIPDYTDGIRIVGKTYSEMKKYEVGGNEII